MSDKRSIPNRIKTLLGDLRSRVDALNASPFLLRCAENKGEKKGRLFFPPPPQSEW